MRLVEDETGLRSALQAAQSEALASFGDEAVYIEKAIVRPRHIEIQIFSDSHGNHVHLGERECSIQRRHQKVIEEAPSPINSAELREKMGTCAVMVAKAVDYVGAGNVEFLVSDLDKSFYFLEMNTRIQVEHPVTELVTGIDLVREQIRVAAGGRLPFPPGGVPQRGWALERRITRWEPPGGPGVRLDSHAVAGYQVPPNYDSLVAKLLVHQPTRDEALACMRRALGEFVVEGIHTTIPIHPEMM